MQYDIDFVVSGKYEFESRETGYTSEIKSAATNVTPVLIATRDRTRIEIQFRNIGTVPGNVYLSRSKDNLKRFVEAGQPPGLDIIVLRPGDVFAPVFPAQSDIFAFAFLTESPDLRVYETLIKPFLRRINVR